ncbi:sigma-70 family RNA polymerase sigma factor [uncultured Microbacterium sp.]|uniref:sigma-70 family RNA polymerase sigma factor n=1 Tax=uncultured Microbacterium sp. TaxID=191216 RepID=UPI0025EF8409|nr:sigma-70 family RNA polymerase sigma factor [uncultured Microbacterium sp.]
MTDQTALSQNDAEETPARSDADLVLRSRSGDAEAFGELWRRHYRSGIAVARSVTGAFDPDDLVQEAFARIYQAISAGGGPTGSFRAYLFTSIRNTAASWGRARREDPIDELDSVADPSSTTQAAEEALDHSLSAQAFRSLPSRWQEVLWYSEIEQMKPGEIAPLLGLSAGATAQLAFRAREGLREAWIQAHLRTAEPGSACAWTIEHLGAYARDNLGVRDRAKLDAHLSECARCLIVAAEAKEVSHRLTFVLLPLVIGVGGSGAYLAALQSGTVPTIALAAMPSGVVEGAVLVGGSGAAAAAGGAAGAGSAGGGTTSGGAFAGFGALVGAGSVALVIAGAIVAAAVVPSLSSDPSSTSAPSASDQDESGIVAQVAAPAGPVSSPAPLAPVTAPTTPPAAPPAPPAAQDAPPAAAPAESAAVAPPLTVTPTEPPTVPGTDPGKGPGTDPGTDPGKDPGTDPGTDPGIDPGTDSGTDPGTDPGTPALPTTPPLLGAGQLSCQIVGWHRDVTVTVALTGVPGTTVRATIETADAGRVVLDGTGAATFVLHPTARQVNRHATATFSYVRGDEVGGSTTFDLGSLGSAHWWECLAGSGTTPPNPAPSDPVTPPTTDPAPEEPAPGAAPANPPVAGDGETASTTDSAPDAPATSTEAAPTESAATSSPATSSPAPADDPDAQSPAPADASAITPGA